jgi:hypothetical protein
MTQARQILVAMLMLLLAACASTPPRNTANICSMFEERHSWFKAARKSEKRWNVPMEVTMAFIQQESSFEGKARPPRTKLLWVIPWKRPSNAYGYAQALDSTWNDYQESAGNWGARRSKFEDAADFIGWYNNNSANRNRIPRNDAYNLYLAYHEGSGGFSRGTYNSKPWLLDVARNVQGNASAYEQQLLGCEKELSRNWFMRLFF